MTFRLPSLDDSRSKDINDVVSVYKKSNSQDVGVNENNKKVDQQDVILSVNNTNNTKGVDSVFKECLSGFSYDSIESDNLLYLMKMFSKEVYYCEDKNTLQGVIQFCRHVEKIAHLKSDLVDLKFKLEIE